MSDTLEPSAYLIQRCEAAIRTISQTAADTGIMFPGEDVIDLVERDLLPMTGVMQVLRRAMIRQVISDIVTRDQEG
ncbi:hypothetical protein [Micropruina sp.]|uniref:hypothetical protein n=1 Tax=Micropruina sp. TaxID=2737536 RepID=UPI0039E5ED23